LRGQEWLLTREQFASIVINACVYCGAAPKTRFFWRHKSRTESIERVNGVDRVKNEGGYTPENSVACCTKCNAMKSDLSLREFLAHIAKIMMRKA
jgi:hypothetical protein